MDRKITRDFDLLFEGVSMRAIEENVNGKQVKFIVGTASSTAMDLYQSIIGYECQQKMLGKLRSLAASMKEQNSGLTAWLNHSYKIPEDTLGAFVAASLTTREEGGGTFVDLDIKCRITETNPRAVAAWQQVADGIRHGWSIGAIFTAAHFLSDDPDSEDFWTLIVDDIDLLEVSLVGIPANQRAWCRSDQDLKDLVVMKAEEIVKEAREKPEAFAATRGFEPNAIRSASVLKGLSRTIACRSILSHDEEEAPTVYVRHWTKSGDCHQGDLDNCTQCREGVADSTSTSPITASADPAVECPKTMTFDGEEPPALEEPVALGAEEPVADDGKEDPPEGEPIRGVELKGDQPEERADCTHETTCANYSAHVALCYAASAGDPPAATDPQPAADPPADPQPNTGETVNPNAETAAADLPKTLQLEGEPVKRGTQPAIMFSLPEGTTRAEAEAILQGIAARCSRAEWKAEGDVVEVFKDAPGIAVWDRAGMPTPEISDALRAAQTGEISVTTDLLERSAQTIELLSKMLAVTEAIEKRDPVDGDIPLVGLGVSKAIGHAAKAVGHGLCIRSASHIGKAIECLAGVVDQPGPVGDADPAETMSADKLAELVAKTYGDTIVEKFSPLKSDVVILKVPDEEWDAGFDSAAAVVRCLTESGVNAYAIKAGESLAIDNEIGTKVAELSAKTHELEDTDQLVLDANSDLAALKAESEEISESIADKTRVLEEIEKRIAERGDYKLERKSINEAIVENHTPSVTEAHYKQTPQQLRESMGRFVAQGSATEETTPKSGRDYVAMGVEAPV